MEVMAELAERVAMEVMQTAGMLEMGDEEENNSVDSATTYIIWIYLEKFF